MHLYNLLFLLAAIAVVAAAGIEPEGDLQAEETNVAHTRQKRAPLLLKKLLIGGLLAKKALLVGGGIGLAGAGVGALIGHKFSGGHGGYPVYVNNGPSGPSHGGGSPVYFDHSPPARPPVYYDQYPPANPSGHYGTPVYPSYPRPLPPPPSYGPDCYTGPSSYNQLYNSARASAGYA